MDITSKIITAFIDTLYRNENEDLMQLRDFAEENRVPIIRRDTEGLLLSLLRIRRPENVLEIGAAIGYSACCFADGCGCRVVTIESDAESCRIARSNIESMGFADRVSVLEGDAREVLLSLADSGESFDAVFIDASKSHYKEFWDLAMPLCTDEAIILCDNVLMKGMTVSDEYDPKRKYKTSIRRMREFIQYIMGLPYADTCILPVGDGVSVSVIDWDKCEEIVTDDDGQESGDGDNE